MVGDGVVVACSNQGTSISPSAVLELNYTKTLNVYAIFTTGVLESLDAPNTSHHFDPIFLVAYRESPYYEYTQIAEAESSCSSVGKKKNCLGLIISSLVLDLKLSWKVHLDWNPEEGQVLVTISCS